MDAAATQPRPGALLLAPPGNTAWVADADRILRGLGFAVQTDVRAPEAAMGADCAVLIADAAVAMPVRTMQAWGARGTVCAVVLPVGAAPPATGARAALASLRVPVTEAALLAMLAGQHYLALSAREAAGIAPAIARQTFGNPVFASELLQALVTSTRDDLAQLRAAGADLDTVRGVAHRLKASAHYVACHGLRGMAQRLEHAARDGNGAIAAALTAIVAQTVARLLSLLTALAAAK
ncbi:Hpt domain-containing protein [Cupriavidus necator]|uniref:Hpt domain-containing protein n=1 Tax=Cupriavidus necator TaxID=106590 RepID=UPI0027820F2C|nr:Hpt domain-containing protein [Cupriavidus necator]MDQ0138813.1 HPt (histidine-containing phosphotransfer) domain-containing protein [Cupriavidus necator]